jgi:hypothetical protein
MECGFEGGEVCRCARRVVDEGEDVAAVASEDSVVNEVEAVLRCGMGEAPQGVCRSAKPGEGTVAIAVAGRGPLADCTRLDVVCARNMGMAATVLATAVDATVDEPFNCLGSTRGTAPVVILLSNSALCASHTKSLELIIPIGEPHPTFLSLHGFCPNFTFVISPSAFPLQLTLLPVNTYAYCPFSTSSCS